LVAVIVSLTVVAAYAPILHADSKTIVKDQYIVVFNLNSTVAIRDLHVAELVARRFVHGDSILNVFDIGTLIGYSAVLTKETLALEQAHPNVRYIEVDQVMSITENTQTQTGATWGIDRIDRADLPLAGSYEYWISAGTGVTAYIIDTGIKVTHTEFGGRAIFGTSTITGEANDDLNGHGTHVAGTVGGTVYGVAKKVTLVAVKVLSGSGSGTTAGVISGVQWATGNHNNRGKDARSVANMSLGGGASTTLDQAVTESITAGVNYAIAAGNNNANACTYSPARVPTAITVGATSSNDARASFSNFGTCVDTFAPGDGITSSWITSNTATNTISGTSMAAPHVAGVVALRLANLLADGGKEPPAPADVEKWVQSTSTPGKVTNPGTGSPNRLIYSLAK